MSARQERLARKQRQRTGEEAFAHIKPQKRKILPPRSNRDIRAYIKKYDPPMPTTSAEPVVE